MVNLKVEWEDSQLYSAQRLQIKGKGEPGSVKKNKKTKKNLLPRPFQLKPQDLQVLSSC